ncbi:MAG: ribonuclease P protein component [Bacteroidales bacterium]|nr:ribonuclease P protein component [Bacteroidales bacterium]
MKTSGFPKSAHLCGKNNFQMLFNQGKTIYSPVVKLIYVTEKSDHPERKVAVAVSKRVFHNAVDRNRLKRQMREAYRLNQTLLDCQTAHAGECVHLLFVYNSHEKCDYINIEKSIKSLLHRFLKY